VIGPAARLGISFQSISLPQANLTAANDFPCPNPLYQNGLCPSVATVTPAASTAPEGGEVVT